MSSHSHSCKSGVGVYSEDTKCIVVFRFDLYKSTATYQHKQQKKLSQKQRQRKHGTSGFLTRYNNKYVTYSGQVGMSVSYGTFLVIFYLPGVDFYSHVF